MRSCHGLASDVAAGRRIQIRTAGRSQATRPLHPTVDPTPIVIEERWSDFRFVDGALHPIRLEQWNITEGTRLTWLEIASIEPYADATEAAFAKPD